VRLVLAHGCDTRLPVGRLGNDGEVVLALQGQTKHIADASSFITIARRVIAQIVTDF
jgi:hypothetical protein